MRYFFMMIVALFLVGCSSPQEKSEKKSSKNIDINKPPKCKSEEGRRAMTLYFNTDYNHRGLTLDRMIELEKKHGYKHDVFIVDDLGIIAGTRTRVCKVNVITTKNGKITYRQWVDRNFMYWYDEDNGSLIVKDWKKGQEN